MQENKKRTIRRLNKILIDYDEVLSKDDQYALKNAIKHLREGNSDDDIRNELILSIIRVVSRPEVLEEIVKWF